MDRIKGKVAVITGAGSGIGLAATKLFVQEGAKVLGIDIDDGALAQVAALGDSARTFVADVTQEAQMEQAMAAAAEQFGGIDVVCANAGIWPAIPTPVENYSIETFNKVMTVNVTGVLITMKYAIPHLERRGGGSIMITSSGGGVCVMRNHIAYHTSKHALTGLARVAALEQGAKNIRVNVVAPAVVDTPMMWGQETQANPEHPELARAKFEGLTLFKRYVTAEEVAKMMLFLASDDAAVCTGQLYFVDGGRSIPCGPS
jgi:NAD(P)-dependent dehydrogenase (short-subunit alcohol dehydrogenase family)